MGRVAIELAYVMPDNKTVYISDDGSRVGLFRFVADNPGDWMFHCHILEHQVAGMMGIFRVS